MSDGAPQPGNPEEDDGDGPRSWKAAAPFLIAFGVVAILVIALVASGIFRPAEERQSDTWRVQSAINAVYESQSSVDWDSYRGAFCQQVVDSEEFPSADEFRETNRRETDQYGKYFIDITDIEIDGDAATATVKATRKDVPAGQEPETVDVRLEKADGKWKVCSLP